MQDRRKQKVWYKPNNSRISSPLKNIEFADRVTAEVRRDGAVDQPLPGAVTTRPSRLLRLTWLGMAVVLCAWSVRAQSIMLEQGEEFEPTMLLLPYAFYNESIEFGAGPVFASSGFLQEQMSLVATGYASTSGSWAGFLLGRDIDVPLLDRLFLHTLLSVARYEEFDSYIDGNPAFPNERAGSNESSEDNFITANADDEFVRFTFHYL